MLNLNEFQRNCPKCTKVITFNNKYNAKKARKKNSICKSCTWEKYKESCKGEKNPFYGKHHTKETIDKIINNRDQSFAKTEEFKQKMSSVTKGEKNGMFGQKVYQTWVDKYGKEEADKKMSACKKKHSQRSSGKGNPMYGKPAPQGCGNGWKGWYKNMYFRSLRELFFIIDYIEKNNWSWESGEKKCHKIEYQDYKGKVRNYFPDYIIENKYIYEIKPKKLWNTPCVLAKQKAAIAYAKKLNLTYILVDPIINYDILKKLYNNKEIKFLPKSEELFLNFRE